MEVTYMTYERPKKVFISTRARKNSKLKTALLGLNPPPIAELRKESRAFEKLMMERKAVKHTQG